MKINIKDIVNLDYERKPVTVSLRGKTFELPSRSAELIDNITVAENMMNEAKSGIDKALAYIKGISVFIGKEAAEKFFPKAEAARLDLDELQRTYNILVKCVTEKSREILSEEYSP